tara:strand:+ start:1392 stop:1703 length:312 start_codon:yes stop_codon:yes gene_type:complete
MFVTVTSKEDTSPLLSRLVFSNTRHKFQVDCVKELFDPAMNELFELVFEKKERGEAAYSAKFTKMQSSPVTVASSGGLLLFYEGSAAFEDEFYVSFKKKDSIF